MTGGELGIRNKLLFALIFAVLLLQLMISPRIWHHGEAREGLVVQGIVHNHQWILPFRNGELPSKPPLFHWIAALPALLFGVNDFTVRFPSLIGAEIMAITTFLLGQAMGGRKTAWLAVGALLGMYEFWDSAAQARVDMVFSACVTVAIAGFYFWYCDRSNAARATCYIAAACAVLAKGPAGIALVGLVIVVFLGVERRFGLLGSLWSWPLVVIVLVIDLGWYGLAYHIGGDAFLALQLQHENIDRALGTGDFDDHQDLLVLAVWFVTRMLPWNLVLPWSLIRRLRGAREDAAGHLLHVWWFSMAVLFALAAGKRAVYLLPLYPAIALLAARATVEFGHRWAQFSATPGWSFGVGTPLPRRAAAKLIIAGIVAIDLAALIGSNGVWRNVKVRTARLSAIDKIGSMVPSNATLFATPEVDNTELIVIAYRLGREVKGKMLMCANGDDYFLSPIDSSALPGVENQT
ncbi:MAG TPA: glycosyltransferase family 39 protein, partial [Candidatus Limnocylindrales bacterium]|nr:glycosyltransferase family 39 protein [Candidatus Limnocylindrales bacterium]